MTEATRSTVDAPVRRRVGRPGALEWDKEGPAVLTVRGHLELPAAVTLTGTPTVRIDKLTVLVAFAGHRDTLISKINVRPLHTG
ncbi:hypothetical protein LCGC14_2150430 [marine sediment metagenome]|uniref:Uncharacterized protein n=1 Tax=marine sediment metagenome TaxID=412755 RepID=A0A0F9DVV7_9ZZZZ